SSTSGTTFGCFASRPAVRGNQPSRVLRPKPNSLDTAIAVSPSAIRSHATFKIRSRSRSSNRFRGPRCRRAFAISLFSALNSLGLAMPQRCPRPARPSRRGRASTYVVLGDLGGGLPVLASHRIPEHRGAAGDLVLVGHAGQAMQVGAGAVALREKLDERPASEGV